MPCYDPPPPWADEARRNAEQAVKIVCALARHLLDNGQMFNLDLLRWYLQHRRIDLQQGRALTPLSPNNGLIEADIRRCELLLDKLELAALSDG